MAITFSTQNLNLVTINYFSESWKLTIPLYLLVLVSVLIGIILAGIGLLVDSIKFRKVLKEKESIIRELKKKIAES
ncbi:MAG: lipopolysaccharide assembly protein LapA domain-containing protein [Thermodesulfobacteriota bacterium]|nr:lipopolysaccharide assembly protein LapA domain-containing protein [Thermodesulfobacteriota bacterium]